MANSIKHNNETYIPESELWSICKDINSIGYLMREIDDNFFAFNPKNEEGKFSILYEFPRMRALTNAMYSLLLNVENTLKKNNIFVYDDKTA
ncbi:MAG: hypothetical protein ACI4RI_06295 [Ruminococcus sp.]